MKGVFKCTKEDDERRSRSAKRSSLGMPPAPSRNIQGNSSVLAWGFPMHPLLHQQLSVRPSPHYIFITSCVMCYAWSTLHLLFSFSLFSIVFFAGHNNLDPSLLCLGEKHAPLLPRMLIVFTSIFVECSFFVTSCCHV